MVQCRGRKLRGRRLPVESVLESNYEEPEEGGLYSDEEGAGTEVSQPARISATDKMQQRVRVPLCSAPVCVCARAPVLRACLRVCVHACAVRVHACVKPGGACLTMQVPDLLVCSRE